MARQGLDPKIVIAIISVVVLVLVVVFWEVWHSSAAGSATSTSGAAAAKPAKMEHGAPNADQMKQIQEWKKTHPNAYTRF
jgi:predicted negative regulator of RcsB-dependent stress response